MTHKDNEPLPTDANPAGLTAEQAQTLGVIFWGAARGTYPPDVYVAAAKFIEAVGLYAHMPGWAEGAATVEEAWKVLQDFGIGPKDIPKSH